MSTRTMRAAEVGWTVFRAGDERPSLAAINEELRRSDLPTISARMYDHYGRLARHGFDFYKPINELDMFVKAERQRQKSG
jgi:hypothetical protein